MGSKVLAVCECGLKKEILIGGGMFTFTYECFFPCLCENCNDVVEVNLLEEIPHCPICENENIIAYDHSSVVGEIGNKIVDSWSVQGKINRELLLTNGTYLCPKCNNNMLHFEGGELLWD